MWVYLQVTRAAAPHSGGGKLVDVEAPVSTMVDMGLTQIQGCRLVSAMSKVPKLVDLCVAAVADELLRGNYARFSQLTVSVSHGMADLVSYGNADRDSEQNFFLAMTKIMGTLGVLTLDPWRLFLFVLKLECPWRFDFSWYDAAYH
ncbi:hypothetical protein BUALT_Bualt07G0084400 [Buddleja alternifolia]|uniref:Uncharacterized protein n=1 Tax=Buddleja alternifolia TaxID=168488 RepID=A0AAV6XA43_9LAMI|nr:hypothetical protein BUALT_Bualt07G0084400 [Buddleja alternifolia]